MFELVKGGTLYGEGDRFQVNMFEPVTWHNPRRPWTDVGAATTENIDFTTPMADGNNVFLENLLYLQV